MSRIIVDKVPPLAQRRGSIRVRLTPRDGEPGLSQSGLILSPMEFDAVFPHLGASTRVHVSENPEQYYWRLL